MSLIQKIFKTAASIAYNPSHLQAATKALNTNTKTKLLTDLEESISQLTPKSLNLDTHEFDENSIKTMNIYEDELLSLTVFSLSSGKILPLHDHPGMLGFFYLITGEITLTNYNKKSEKNYRLTVEKTQNSIVKGPFLSFLTPTHNNLHTIKALSNCLIFDIFMPSYSWHNPCTYYRKLTESQFIQYFPNLDMQEIEYKGEPLTNPEN